MAGKLGKGAIDYRTEERVALHRILEHSRKGKSWDHNFSYKRFKDRFWKAVSTDAHLQEGCFEWTRKVLRCGKIEEVICCPEDVRVSSGCDHDEWTVCAERSIPICNECWTLALEDEPIPKALANDNFKGTRTAS